MMSNLKIYPIARALASTLLPASLLSRPGSGGTCSAEYCYSVWMRHWKSIAKLGLFDDWARFKTVAEIGPGDTLGIGISALYTGFEKYFGFDVVKHANTANNIAMTAKLADYFEAKTKIPDASKFPKISPTLGEYAWPEDLVRERGDSIESLKKEIIAALEGKATQEVEIDYQVPWDKSTSILEKEVDLIFSQAVMEHVDDIQAAYRAMFEYLRPGGLISHQVDFKTHEMTNSWNGHWYVGEYAWRFVHSARKYPLNRMPFSSHIAAINNAGFEVKHVQKVEKFNENEGRKPRVPDVVFTNEDLTTSGAYIVAQRPE